VLARTEICSGGVDRPNATDIDYFKREGSGRVLSTLEK
jgi:hypothetical protein